MIPFYFGGMRAANVLCLKWSDFKDNRLHYTMGKNNKPGLLKASDKVAYIQGQYIHKKRFTNDYVFPELKELANLNDKFAVNKYISSKVTAISGMLKKFVGPLSGVTHKVTLHIARHTFGNIAGQMEISLIMLQKIFRHSVITTTIRYG